MNKFKLFVLILTIISLSTSCKRKKYTEVVEVPLPTSEEKLTMGLPEDVKADEGAFQLVSLPYKYDALIPSIDVLTMETHYSKHYLAYTNGLNKAIAGTELESLPIEDIFKKLDLNNSDVRNNLGGYYNHTLFFETIGPKNNGQPKDSLATKIDLDFGSFENFKTQFINTANSQFGSGWVWLVVDNNGKLQITNTQNQDNPLMPRAVIPGKPILGLDLWENAYYIDYKYKRKKYIDNYFNIINWDKVNEKFESAISK